MGSPNAQAYLASPAVVASSALAGYITYEWESEVSVNNNIGSITLNPKLSSEKINIQIINGFPSIIEGEMIFCYQDNLNTDGIYPGKYTYQDDMTPEQQSKVVMENYDPQFVNIAQKGDILIGGFNFGNGSSREQAATALKYKGIQLVIAGSFNETYKRNAINNGFLTIECPELVDDLKSKFGTEKLTIKTGIKVQIDFSKSELKAADKTYLIAPVGATAQELIVYGGLEEWVKKNIPIL